MEVGFDPEFPVQATWSLCGRCRCEAFLQLIARGIAHVTGPGRNLRNGRKNPRNRGSSNLKLQNCTIDASLSSQISGFTQLKGRIILNMNVLNWLIQFHLLGRQLCIVVPYHQACSAESCNQAHWRCTSAPGRPLLTTSNWTYRSTSIQQPEWDSQVLQGFLCPVNKSHSQVHVELHFTDLHQYHRYPRGKSRNTGNNISKGYQYEVHTSALQLFIAPPGHEEQTLSTFLCQGLCCDQTKSSHATAQQITGIWRQGHTPWNG